MKVEESVWNKIIGWFIENRLISFLLAGLVVVFGLYTAPFDWKWGAFPRDPVAMDAIPDIGENQQIVFTEWAGRSPRDVEDQITYPLTTAMLGIPGVRTVRSSSAFGFSSIYVIFEDDVEFYWSRSRVLEKLASLPAQTVPDGVRPTLGPDATALGQIFWYTLQGQDEQGRVVGGWDPHELRAIQDWDVRYALQSVPGVSEVASVGGFVQEYQVDVDPEAMRAHQVTLGQVASAVSKSNLDVGARTMEINQVEYIVRGLGFVRELSDLESTVVVARENTPIRIRDLARVQLGPALRRGALDDEGAPAVGGVVVARYRENPLAVISAVKEKIAQIAPGLPERRLEDGGVSKVRIVPFYDRTSLISETLSTLSGSLLQEIMVTVIVVLLLLGNLRSSLLLALILPLGVLATFVVMKGAGVDANVMALGGIAIAIGTMVDIGIVFVENINQHLERDDGTRDRSEIVRAAAAEVAPAVLTSVLTTVVSFLPVLGLSSSEFRLFAPLAWTKTFAMISALGLSFVLIPGAALLVFRSQPGAPQGAGWAGFVRGTFRVEHLRDWILLLLGLGVLSFVHLVGALVALLGAYRLLRPHLGLRTQRWCSRSELALACLAVVLLLAEYWSPLGYVAGAWLNFVFVATLIMGVLGSFRLFEHLYPRLLAWVLHHKLTFLTAPLLGTILGACALFGTPRVLGFLPHSWLSAPPLFGLCETFPGLGREYMPPFDEGSFLYMPTTMPHASIGEAQSQLSQMDAAIAQIPEVDRVVGKLGRVDSALDPAPVAMFETMITYRPEFTVLESGGRVRNWREHIRSPQDIWDEVVRVAERPGLTSAPVLMPIQARMVMLQTGMRASLGLKVRGPHLEEIEQFGIALAEVLKEVPAIRSETVFADRVVGKPYLEIDIDREAIGRFGLNIQDVQEVLQIALGGATLSRSVEGRERYPIRVRYMREERDSLEALGRIFIPTPQGAQIPLSQIAELRYKKGPQVIKSEDTFLTSYVLFDKQPEVDDLGVVSDARSLIEQKIASGALIVPAGVSFEFAGSYQNQVRSEQRLSFLVPLALVLVFVLLYLQFKRMAIAGIIYVGVFVAVSGGALLLWMYGQPWFLDFSLAGTDMRELFQIGPINLSVAVWIGFIALVGIATDDGVVVSTYLKQLFDERKPTDPSQVRALTLEAGMRRVRPCLMTTATTILALLPVITSQGRGSDIMVPMALPALGGMMVELMTLFVVPVLYCALEERRLSRKIVPLSSSTVVR